MTEKEKFIYRLYIEYYDYMLRIALNLMRNTADAEDLIHDVFEIAMKKYDELVVHENPKAWLTFTLKNCIKNYNRLHENKSTISLEEFGDIIAPEGAEPLSHILPSQLPAGDREILIWYYEQKMSYDEMSEKLGISPASCRVKVCRIVKRCRRLMGK